MTLSAFSNSNLLFIRILLATTFNLFVLFNLEHAFASSEMSSFNLIELASGLYVHHGKHVGFESPEQDDIANIGFIVGDKCIAVIDTGGSVRIARELQKIIRQTSDKPICYVINTHIHFDHVLGNVVFRNPGTKFVGHKNLADEMIANQAFFLEEYGKNLGDQPGADSLVGPDILVDGKMTLDLGNRKLQISAYGAAHSHSDISVFDEKTKSLWLSDLLFNERIPSLDGSLRGWLKLMQELARIEATYTIPGHGSASAKAEDSFARQFQYLQTILHQTRKGIAQGQFMEDIVEQVGLEEKRKWLLYEQHHKRNVTRAFSELEWE